MQDEIKQLVEQVEAFLENSEIEKLTKILADERTSDIAEIVETLETDQVRIIFDVLKADSAAEVLEKVDEATRDEIFDILNDAELALFIQRMDKDDAADILSELSDEKERRVLESLPFSDALRIRRLMRYSEDSAGGIMDPVLINVAEDATVSEAVAKIRSAEIDEDFYNVYVTDSNENFVGEVRIRLLLTARETAKIKTLLTPDSIYVYAEDDQETVRNIFSKNDLITVPVLDKDNHLVGRITADRVIEVAEEEAAEDLFRMAGTGAEELDKFSPFHAARIRMAWLLPCLLGTGFTAFVLTLFDTEFHFKDMAIVYTTAVAFVPMIAAISGNAGLQTSAIVISGLATGHLAALEFRQVFSREVRIAMLVALACGVVGGSVCALLLKYRNPCATANPLLLVLSFSSAMVIAIMVATTLGLVLPFLFKKIGIDPAISSGPLVTTANDSISVAIYMSLTLLLVTI